MGGRDRSHVTEILGDDVTHRHLFENPEISPRIQCEISGFLPGASHREIPLSEKSTHPQPSSESVRLSTLSRSRGVCPSLNGATTCCVTSVRSIADKMFRDGKRQTAQRLQRGWRCLAYVQSVVRVKWCVSGLFARYPADRIARLMGGPIGRSACPAYFDQCKAGGDVLFQPRPRPATKRDGLDPTTLAPRDGNEFL